MIEVKAISLKDLKSDYSDRHGFVIQFNAVANATHVQKVSDALIRINLTTSPIEFVVEYPNNTFCMIYPKGVGFDCPQFLNYCNLPCKMFGWRVQTLVEYLK